MLYGEIALLIFGIILGIYDGIKGGPNRLRDFVTSTEGWLYWLILFIFLVPIVGYFISVSIISYILGESMWN